MIRNYLKQKADNCGASIGALIGAGTLGQFPQFLAQYLQKVRGHIDEARNSANYLLKMSGVSEELTQRAEDLQSGLDAIGSAGELEKLLQFIRHVDFQIFGRTLENFEPGVTFNSEGILYCGVGALAGLVGYEITKGTLGTLYRRRKNKKLAKKP